MIRRRLVLASASAARRTLLTAAGLSLDIDPAGIDEERLRAEGERAGWTSSHLALALAEAKALAVAPAWPGALVLGADQIAVAGATTLAKATTRETAAAVLWSLRGRSHRLISAAAIVADGGVAWRYAETAVLTMRRFSAAELTDYLDHAGDDVTACVGGYRIEGPGVQLFERIEGAQSTIMGLPLLPVLAALRDLDGTAA